MTSLLCSFQQRLCAEIFRKFLEILSSRRKSQKNPRLTGHVAHHHAAGCLLPEPKRGEWMSHICTGIWQVQRCRQFLQGLWIHLRDVCVLNFCQRKRTRLYNTLFEDSTSKYKSTCCIYMCTCMHYKNSWFAQLS